MVDHYFTRSYAEWREKMARGSCDPHYAREDDWFLRLNPELADQLRPEPGETPEDNRAGDGSTVGEGVNENE